MRSPAQRRSIELSTGCPENHETLPDDQTATMELQPLDILLAFKAMAIMPDLSAAERRVAGAIVDHFNRRDCRCDPGIDRLADLLSLDRRTVLRSVARLHRLGLVAKKRHGGRLLRNSYEPVWERFRAFEAAWKACFNENATAKSPKTRPTSHLGSGEPVTQTFRRNLSIEPVQGQAGKERDERAARSALQLMSSASAASVAAERRWGTDMLTELSSRDYIFAVESIDDSIRAEATAAEIRKHGDGLVVIRRRTGLVTRQGAP